MNKKCYCQTDIPAPTEAKEQKKLFDWVALSMGRWPELKHLHHSPNGGRRDPKTGRSLKEQGTRAGYPDLCLNYARGIYHGLFIELKRTKGSVVSPAQKGWLEWLNANGNCAVVCYGAKEAIETIEKYLKLGEYTGLNAELMETFFGGICNDN